MVKSFRDLHVYQRSYQASLEIHKISLTFPRFEEHELGRQIRRSTKSIAMNIAEGYGKRSSTAEFKRFIAMAIGSCDEIKSQLDYCRDLGYINQEQYRKNAAEYDEIGKMLCQLYLKWQ